MGAASNLYVVPNEGEDSVHDAATKVGPLAKTAIEAMLAAADRQEQVAKKPATVPPPSGVRPRGELVPSVAHDEDDDDSVFEVTVVNDTQAAAPVAVPARAPTPTPVPKAVETLKPPQEVRIVDPAGAAGVPARVMAPVFVGMPAPQEKSTLTKEIVIGAIASLTSAAALVYILFV